MGVPFSAIDGAGQERPNPPSEVPNDAGPLQLVATRPAVPQLLHNSICVLIL